MERGRLVGGRLVGVGGGGRGYREVRIGPSVYPCH